MTTDLVIDKSVIKCYNMSEVIWVKELFETAIVEKRNILNELRGNNMTLQELRFFSIYLSKIDPYNIQTRIVRFPLVEFMKIMGFGRLNIKQLQASTDSLLCKLVHIPDENGRGVQTFQLFKKSHIFQDDNDEWFVEINAHDDALPLMFEFKNRYFKYELWNALRLKSANQIRMYEILKQYETIGERELTIEELRILLGIDPKDYSGRTGWSDFKKKVIDSCQQALKDTTDIYYTYEKGKSGRGGKWLSVIFYIHKNNEYASPLSLEKFISMQKDVGSSEDETSALDYGSELGNLLGNMVLRNEFDLKQVRVLQDMVVAAVPEDDNLKRCSYLSNMLHKMDVYSPKEEKRFIYLCKMIQNDINNQIEKQNTEPLPEDNDFDIEKYKTLINKF